jgi:hydrogenase maturation protease
LKEPDDPVLFKRIQDLILSDGTCVIGLGNPDRADDGAGIEIVSHWKARLKERAFLDTEISAETAVIEGLEDPCTRVLFFVDAVDFGGAAGELRFFSAEDSVRFQPSLSTHKVPLGLLMQMVTSRNKEAHLLGIQPKSVEWLGGMTKEVVETVDLLKRFINQVSVQHGSDTV